MLFYQTRKLIINLKQRNNDKTKLVRAYKATCYSQVLQDERMQEYEIILKINSLSKVHREYKWEGKTQRSSRENPILLMKAEDELDAYDKIKTLSEGTLEIVSIVKAEDGDQKYVQQMVELATNIYTPTMILMLLQVQGIGVGMN